MIRLKQTLASAIGIGIIGSSLWSAESIIFKESSDTSNFNGSSTTISDSVPDPLVDSGTAISNPSAIGDGDALQMWDLNDAGRTTLRYHPGSPEMAGMQMGFTGLVKSGGAEGTSFLWRWGDPTASLAGGAHTGLDFRLTETGQLKYYYETAEGNAFSEIEVGLDTIFEISVVFNAADLGGDSLTYDSLGEEKTLEPQEYALYVDGEFINTGMAMVSNASYEQNLGIGRIWWLTGTSTAGLSPTVEIDNITLRTGDDIGVAAPPAPLPWEGAMEGDYIVNEWFGAFEVAPGNWLRHTELGWINVSFVESTEDMWMYGLPLQSWVWSNRDTWPVVYDYDDSRWIYYFNLPDIGIYVFDYETGLWTLITG